MLKGKILGMDIGAGLAHRHLGNRHSSTNTVKALFLETGSRPAESDYSETVAWPLWGHGHCT